MCGRRAGLIKLGILTTGFSTVATGSILIWAGSIYNAKSGIKDSPIILGVLAAGFLGCLFCFTLRIFQLLNHYGNTRFHPILVSHKLLLLIQLLTQIALIWHLLVAVADAMALYLYLRTVMLERNDWLWIPPALDLFVFILMFINVFMVPAEMIKNSSCSRVPEEEFQHLIID